jgi:hypothetical protein
MITEEMVYNFISLMDDTGRMYSCEDGFGFYLKLTPEWLEQIRSNPRLLTDPKIMEKLLLQDGKHIHFIGAYISANCFDGLKAMIKGIREVVKKYHPESISWHNKDLTKFIFRRMP